MKIGTRNIGPGCPTLVVAEIGLNHQGSVERALEMVRAAAAAGCGAIKAQAYTPSEFVGSDENHTYLEHNGGGFRRVTERQIDMFGRCALSLDDLIAIAKETRRLGMLFGVTATDKYWIDALRPHVQFYKVGSDDLIHLPLLRILAETGMPVILSTGMADPEEIEAAISVPGLQVAGVLHCVSRYPTPSKDANITRIDAIALLGEAHGKAVPVGYSDHTDGVAAAVVALARGVPILEKHFTLDKKLPGPDQYFSADPAELKVICDYAKMVGAILGSGRIKPSPDELPMRRLARRSIVAAKDITAGQIINESDLAFKRPGDGVSPAKAHFYVGVKAPFSVKAGEKIPRTQILHAGERIIPRYAMAASSTEWKH